MSVNYDVLHHKARKIYHDIYINIDYVRKAEINIIDFIIGNNKAKLNIMYFTTKIVQYLIHCKKSQLYFMSSIRWGIFVLHNNKPRMMLPVRQYG